MKATGSVLMTTVNPQIMLTQADNDRYTNGYDGGDDGGSDDE